MPPTNDDITAARQMHQALVLHFIEGQTQAEIAKVLGLSHATVNRLIKRGRALGLVEIKVKSPIQHLVGVEAQLVAIGGISRAVVAPAVSDNVETTLLDVGALGANLLLESLADGDRICISGGKGVSAIVAGLTPSRRYDVEVVPATGLVQGKHYTDVNHVATMLADRLGGRSYQMHAPLFADSPQEREMVMHMRSVADVFRRAREATIAIVGIGSILSDDSSYYDLHPSSSADRHAIEQSKATGELLAHLVDGDGQVADYAPNRSLVALTLDELAAIPRTIGIASGPNKARPVLAAMRGNYLDTLVTDEATARKIIDLAEAA
ncbi:MAG: Crp/Fnr family transcriptional regulator [Devosia sp.]|uniref:sugar-binding transcriptional regulator n=1 Tax=Devosia sp. TaxID=1871048 RepID=UPI00262DBAF1|nr:sugar-binding transcriptional regulator [Devosia sp.]MDB5588181.1 Crp/Fnr family transcriptional regulator [Devosia sp.]